jgi:hypothetical protein
MNKKMLTGILMFVSFVAVSTLGPQTIEVNAVTYGDYVVDPSRYPEVVSIWEYDDVLNTYFMICTGTLISQVDVLTAAHCVRNAEDLLVEIGAATRGDGYSLYVVGSWYHPRYSDRLMENDIGLLRLGAPANVSQVARLPKPGWRPKPQTRYVLVGWGQDQNGDTGKLRELNSVPLDSYAKTYWRSLFNPRTTISAGRFFREERLFGGACRGDSGGPLFLRDQSPQRTVMGITSWGAKDCESFAPSVFSSTSYAIKEIRRGLAQLDAEVVLDTTPITLRISQSSGSQFTPRFRVESTGAHGSKIKLVCFSINSVDTGSGIRGSEGLRYLIDGSGCEWVSAYSISFEFLSWEMQAGTNVVSVWVQDEQDRSTSISFNLCKGAYTLDLCSPLG